MKRKNHAMRLFLCYFGAVIGLLASTYLLNKWIFSKSVGSTMDLETFPESLITISGILSRKQFPGPPEYSSIDDGDRVDHCWVLELDKTSFLLALNTPVKELGLDFRDILRWKNSSEVMLVLNDEVEKACRMYEGLRVYVVGYLFHAHTVHHYTPMLLDVKKVLDENVSLEVEGCN
jgi:hypothetical protein